MKNCPWFSLRSNSIESRFRSIRGAIFLVHAYVKLNEKKAKSKETMNSLRSCFYSLRSPKI